MFVTVDPVADTRVTHESAAVGQKKPVRQSWFSIRRLQPYLFLLPAVSLLILWTYRPLVETLQLSFYDWNLIPSNPKTFVGLENYSKVVQLPELHTAIWNTVVYILAFFVFSLVLPIIVGLLAKQVSGKLKAFYQALIFVPFLVTPVATGAVWRWLFAEQGMISTIFNGFGIELGNVFREPSTAIWSIIVIVGWQMLGFGVLVVAAGFAGINPDYGHAASIDGASGAQITRRITLPLLSPTVVFLSLMTILLSAQWTFPIIDLLTQGGPLDSTTNIYYLLYQFGFRNFDAGLSASAGILFFIVFGVIAVIFMELQEKLSFYDN